MSYLTPKRLWLLYFRLFRLFADQRFYYIQLDRLIQYHQSGGDNFRSTVTWIKIFLIALVTRFGITLSFCTPLVPAQVRFLLFDSVAVIGYPSSYQLILLSLFGSSVYVYAELYPLRYRPAYDSILWILHELNKLYRLEKSPTNSTSPLGQKLETVLSYTKLMSIGLFISVELYLAYTQVNFFLYHADYSTTIVSTIRLVFIEVNACHFLLCLCLTSKIFLDMCNTLVVFTLMVFDRFEQAEEMHLRRPKNRRFNRINLNRFTRAHSQAFVRVMQMNMIYGPIILTLLLSQYPTNAFLMVDLLVKPYSTIQRLMSSSFVINQLYLLFALHSVAARYSLKISRFTRTAINRFVHLREPFDLLGRLRMSNYVGQFHTRRKFGLTYGSLGLISFVAFFKFSFLYVRFLFKFYQQS